MDNAPEFSYAQKMMNINEDTTCWFCESDRLWPAELLRIQAMQALPKEAHDTWRDLTRLRIRKYRDKAREEYLKNPRPAISDEQYKSDFLEAQTEYRDKKREHDLGLCIERKLDSI